ncbi:uncharacterized protein LOC143862925 [Tasmannia lanceolata]|uniref:uncharacterized protein LOC143862925 n=1 Tax=Tasmannia lanceolata TaxID=3420 RepID=UPI004062CD50
MASPDVRVEIVDSEEEVILDLNTTPLPTDSYHRAEASTTFLPGRAVEVVARARMVANPKYNMRALHEENILDESMMGDIRDRFFCVEDRESTQPWPVPLRWDVQDTIALSRKPFLEGEDMRTFALICEELERGGLIHCGEFSGEAGQRRKAAEISSPAPTQETPPPKGKTTLKLVGAYGRGTGSSKSGGTSTGARPPPTRSGDNVFRPNWAIQRNDSSLGESRVAAELLTKVLLSKDKLQVLNEPPAAADEAIFSSLYQIGLYYNDLREKSKKFSEAITKSEEESRQLMKEAKELQRSIGQTVEENKRLKEELAAQKEKAAEALNAQRERARERQIAAVQKKEDGLISLSSESYKVGFFDCLEQVKESNPAVTVTELVLPVPPVTDDDEPGTTTAAVVPEADPSRGGSHGAS